MAFGFNPNYSVDFPIEGYTNEEYLTLAVETAKALKWNIGYIDEKSFVAYTKFSMSAYSLEVRFWMENGFASLKSACTSGQIMDWGKNKKNVEQFLAVFDQLKATLSKEDLEKKWVELKPAILNGNEELTGGGIPDQHKSSLLSIFVPARNYFITPIIVDLNILIFIFMIISGVSILSPDNESLLNWGANFRPLILEGEWWRLISNFFLHIGILHLLFNMYALIYIGLLLEPRLGRAKFLTAYFATGVAASLTSLFWHVNTISAGASGAIFGMYGVFLALLTTNYIEKATRKALLASIAIFVGYNLMNGVKGGVDNAAHVGGLLSGLLIGYAFYPGLRKPEDEKLNIGIIACIAVLTISIGVFSLKKIPDDMGKYYVDMQSFAEMEKKALGLYYLPENSPKQEVLSSIKDTGLVYWYKNIQLLQDINKLNIPDNLHDQNRKLLHYCHLRIKMYELIYKSVNEDSNEYGDQIKQYNLEIEKVIQSLKGH
jgi:rhomboid protease GluP